VKNIILVFVTLSFLSCATHSINKNGVCYYNNMGGSYKSMADCRKSDEFYKNVKGSKFKKNIIKGEIAKGMSEQEVKWAWGKPVSMNSYKSGKQRQLVYYWDSTGKSRSYVYLTNDRVTNWQDIN